MKKFLVMLFLMVSFSVGAAPDHRHELTRTDLLHIFDSADKVFEVKGKRYQFEFCVVRRILEKLDGEGKFDFDLDQNSEICDLNLFEDPTALDSPRGVTSLKLCTVTLL